MGEKQFPKVDGQIFYASEANGVGLMNNISAGEAISSGNVVYVRKDTGVAFVGDTGAADDIRANGIAMETVTSGNAVNIQVHGVYPASGLTAGSTYYLGAAGAVSATRGAVEVGRAVSATGLAINLRQDDRDALQTVKAWHKNATGGLTQLHAFWKECDGSAISDSESPLSGGNLPDLNSTQRFLRGNSSTGGTGGQDSHSHSISRQNQQYRANFDASRSVYSPNSTQSQTNMPAYFEVVWIMRIK